MTDEEVRKANNDEWRLNSLIAVRAQQVKGDKPPPDRQRARDAIGDAEMRRAQAEMRRAQAEMGGDERRDWERAVAAVAEERRGEASRGVKAAREVED